MNIRYRVDLTTKERDQLGRLLSAGQCAARRLKRAQILLAADGSAGDEDIARTIAASGSTIYRTKRRFVECGLEAALSEQPRRGAEPIPAKPGQVERFDCEYRRNGTANLFVFLDAHGPWRKVKVTDRRAAADFAGCMRDLVDLHFPEAEKIRLVLDNLSTHSPSALYQTVPAPEARRILRRIEFHHTPRHASWLNMVEIEIGVLRCQCLDRRIDNRELLAFEIATWERQRNKSGARINWMFTPEKARAKMARAYPIPLKES